MALLLLANCPAHDTGPREGLAPRRKKKSPRETSFSRGDELHRLKGFNLKDFKINRVEFLGNGFVRDSLVFNAYLEIGESRVVKYSGIRLVRSPGSPFLKFDFEGAFLNGPRTTKGKLFRDVDPTRRQAIMTEALGLAFENKFINESELLSTGSKVEN